LKNISAK